MVRGCNIRDFVVCCFIYLLVFSAGVHKIAHTGPGIVHIVINQRALALAMDRKMGRGAYILNIHTSAVLCGETKDH